MSVIPQGVGLIVGINHYTAGITPLQSAVNDARQLAAILQDEHHYQTTVQLDDEATLAAMMQALETDLPATLNAEQPFLLYFAGHGVARGDGADGPQGYLLPRDARVDDRETWISMDRLRQALEALPCRHVLVILDCCFAGSFRWASTRELGWDSAPLFDSQFERYLKGTAWQALTSAAHDEKALDISPGRDNTRDGGDTATHSPFAAALFRGLAGAADSSRGGHEPDGVITATELFQYAFEELVPAGATSHQTPGIWPLRPDNTGQYIFLNPARAKNTRPDPPLDDGNNPWLGLSAYTAGDAPLFFGRERIVAAVVDRLRDVSRPRLVAIVGASGTGKSSIAKAGVLPRLDHGEWSIARSDRLSATPLDSLHLALDSLVGAVGRKLVYIDQFEELYTQCGDPQRRDIYLQALGDAIDRDDDLTVMLTIRSDFEPQPAGHSALSALWAAGRLVVPAFSADELRECIEGPAQVKALYFEPPSLVGKLVDEVMAMPGGLPLLSFALAQMYQRARARRRTTGAADRALTEADYAATGGVVGALHRRATQLHDASEPARQNTIRRVFLRMLVQDGARLTRRRISQAELRFADADEQARVDQVVAEYVDARLLVTDDGDIEPAHDTLIVAWDKIVEWLSDAGPQNLIRSVWGAASEWHSSSRDPGLSWHDDPRLPLVLSQVDQLNALEQEFVEHSEALRKRRLRRLVSGSVAVGVVIAGAAILALWQWRVALGQQTLAEERLARSQSNAMLAHAQAQTDPLVKGVLVAEIAERGLPQPPRAAPIAREAVEDMVDAVHDFGLVRRSFFDLRRRESNLSVAYRLLTGTAEFDTFGFESDPFRNPLSDAQPSDARYADNERSVVAWYGRRVAFWPEPFGSDIALELGAAVTDVSVAASGYALVVAAAGRARVLRIDQDTGETTERVLTQEDVVSVAMGAQGNVVATGTRDGRVTLLDVATDKTLFEAAVGESVTRLAVDDNAAVVAAGTQTGGLAIWLPAAAAAGPSVSDCGGAIEDLHVSPGGQAVAAVCGRRAWLWSSAAPSLGRAVSESKVARVRFVSWPGSFEHDGLWLLGLSRTDPPLVWPVVTASTATVPEAIEQDTQPLVASGAPSTIYDSATDAYRTLTRVDSNLVARVGEGEDARTVVFTATDPVTGAVLEAEVWNIGVASPDQFFVYHDSGRRHVFAVATEGNHWSGALFNFDAAQEEAAVQTLDGTIYKDAALSPDGKLLIVVSDLMNPNIIAEDPKVYRTGNLQRVARTLPGQEFVRQVTFSADGQRIATTDCRGQTYVWNRNGWNDPIVLNRAESDGPFVCGPYADSGRAQVFPGATFSADGQYVLTRRGAEPPKTWVIGYKTLSEQIRQRTFVCFTTEQREQYFDESPEQSAAAYRQCMIELGLTVRP